MKASLLTRSLAALALGVASTAHAGVIGFDDITPDFLFPSVTSGGATFTSGGTGFSGVDSSAAFFGTAPAGNATQFLYGLNDDAITMSFGGGAFRLLGLDFGFIAPVPQTPGTIAGKLRIAATTSSGVVIGDYDFGSAGPTGVWDFAALSLSASDSVTSVTFSACVYDGLGGCSFASGIGQFAIDNISVPEPGSVALTLAALGLLAATRRRQAI